MSGSAVWESGAQYAGGPLRNCVEYISELTHAGCREAEVFIHQLLSLTGS